MLTDQGTDEPVRPTRSPDGPARPNQYLLNRPGPARPVPSTTLLHRLQARAEMRKAQITPRPSRIPEAEDTLARETERPTTATRMTLLQADQITVDQALFDELDKADPLQDRQASTSSDPSTSEVRRRDRKERGPRTRRWRNGLALMRRRSERYAQVEEEMRQHEEEQARRGESSGVDGPPPRA